MPDSFYLSAVTRIDFVTHEKTPQLNYFGCTEKGILCTLWQPLYRVSLKWNLHLVVIHLHMSDSYHQIEHNY